MITTMTPTTLTRSYGTVSVAVTFDNSAPDSTDVFDAVIKRAESVAAAYVLGQTKAMRSVDHFAPAQQTTDSVKRSFTFQPVGSDDSWIVQIEYTVNRDNSALVPVAKLTQILNNALVVVQKILVDKLLAPVDKTVADIAKATVLDEALKDVPSHVAGLIRDMVGSDSGHVVDGNLAGSVW